VTRVAEYRGGDGRLETLAVHAGQEPDPSTGAVMTPVFQTSTYAQRKPGEHQGFEYSRTRNPTRDALEANLAALEGGRFGLAFGSGCAASAAIQHCLQPGDRVLVAADVYGGTFRLFDKVFRKSGIDYVFLDCRDAAAVERAMAPKCTMLWLETPSNPMLMVLDLERLSALGRKHGATVVVDNTFATPVLQRPLSIGADLVVHSTTKYLGGHSDVVGGAIVTSNPDWHARLAFVQNAVGAVPGPWDCFLTLRGTKTLHLRMERHCSNATAIARWLEKHRRVKSVIYPGLESHPQHALAKKQMGGAFGGMVTFTMDAPLEEVRERLGRFRVFALAESLGGVESLIEHPAIMTHASIPKETREKLGISDGLVRLSVGVEHVDDLIADLDAALR
jgi:cystathionine gamma-lyase